MKLYDISQEVMTCKVFPGDPAPRREILSTTAEGSVCNLSALSMCAHNGTHVDAPYHFLGEGKTVEQFPLERYVGVCFVAEHQGDVTACDAERILGKAREEGAWQRILLKGEAVVTLEAAKVFSASGVLLLGNESQTVGPENAPMAVHLELLGAEVILLEGIRLNAVPEGRYILSAAPLNLGGFDGAPCRAFLMDMEG